MNCIKTLTIAQLIKLAQRFGINPRYKNPRKRKMALKKALASYWRMNPIEDCAICWEPIHPDKLFITPCVHLFCGDCLLAHINITEKCPLCRADCSYTYVINKIYELPKLFQITHVFTPILVEEQESDTEPMTVEWYQNINIRIRCLTLIINILAILIGYSIYYIVCKRIIA